MSATKLISYVIYHLSPIIKDFARQMIPRFNQYIMEYTWVDSKVKTIEIPCCCHN